MSCLVVLFFLLAVTCNGMHHGDNAYLGHVQRVHEFRCDEPQLQAVPVAELIEISNPDEIFYPLNTVLLRCGGTGCCFEEDHTCGAIESRNISLVFLVKHRYDHRRLRHHEIINAVEHVKCGCVKRDYEVDDDEDVVDA